MIFTSDNGGMEGGPTERYTDNEPLARGKISAMEGGTRVPLLIAGPGIRPGVQTDVMANGLDFYPTVLSMTGTPKPPQKNLDGCDLLPLLQEDPRDPRLVKHADGTTRDTMVWHFPHGGALESTIRVGDYKLVRNYDHVNNPGTAPLELFQLYDSSSSDARRLDIEESRNLAEAMPELTAKMNARLTAALTRDEGELSVLQPRLFRTIAQQGQALHGRVSQKAGTPCQLYLSRERSQCHARGSNLLAERWRAVRRMVPHARYSAGKQRGHQHGIYANYLQVRKIGADRVKLDPTGSLPNRLKDAGYAPVSRHKVRDIRGGTSCSVHRPLARHD